MERQKGRPANRRVPEKAVRAQHAAMVDAFPGLPAEGFDHVVVAENLYRLQALLQQLSDARRADLGWDDSEGLGALLLVRRIFGPEILPMWRWRDNSQLADGDRVAEIRLGADRIVLAQRSATTSTASASRSSLAAPPTMSAKARRGPRPTTSPTFCAP
ncbi:hypothetical protein OG345_40985 (plasmid) [Streptomyces sp. NBC_01220]|uniref:hypothetical protein n=1 Tax=Streptomyces sp. NBC_01220 TaxID=2903781 RepID=UPI002F909E4D|nr:hypothetical protein OG345_40985 [Streptomyces sp. NBC_01220]